MPTAATDAPEELCADGCAPLHWSPLVSMLACAFLLSCLGCRSGVIGARGLPAELIAPPMANIDELDLSRLAGRSVRNDFIYRGDILQITAATGMESQAPHKWQVRVAQDGTADLPLIGRMNLSELDIFTAEQLIREAAIQRGIYRNPAVTVAIQQRHANKVTVVGAVEKPGSYELPVSNSDLFAALVAAGGLSDEADERIEIRHPPQSPGVHSHGYDPVIAAAPQAQLVGMPNHAGSPSRPGPIEVHLTSATTAGHAHPLEDGAVVMVMKRPPRYIHVMGLVSRPGEYELRRNEDVHLLDAIAMAGGTTINVANKVYVIRQLSEHQPPQVIEVSMRDAKHDEELNLRLAAGDVVSVEETPLTFVLGTIQRFINVGVGLSGGIPLF